jgi:UDP-N-acetyl-D-glucosamine dehydrogenase
MSRQRPGILLEFVRNGLTMTTHGLAEKIAGKTAVIGVIGLGYVGLPLIRAFVRAGFTTMGFDVDQTKVDKLKAGQSYIKHIDSSAIARLIQEKQFEPTSDMTRLREADCVIICVPTPLNESRDPDLSYIEGTAHSIAKTLRPGQLVVLECNGAYRRKRVFSGIQPRAGRSRQPQF